VVLQVLSVDIEKEALQTCTHHCICSPSPWQPQASLSVHHTSTQESSHDSITPTGDSSQTNWTTTSKGGTMQVVDIWGVCTEHWLKVRCF